MADHHLPWDAARCSGAKSDDPAEVFRHDCETCLRRLAAPHPTRGAVWLSPQPEPCEYRILPWQP